MNPDYPLILNEAAGANSTLAYMPVRCDALQFINEVDRHISKLHLSQERLDNVTCNVATN